MTNRDTETVIVERGSSGAGVIVGIVVVALIVIGGYFLLFNGNGGSRTIDVDVPAVSVNVTPDGQ